MDIPAVITRVKDLKPLSISDFGSVNLKVWFETLSSLSFVADREFVTPFCTASTEHLPTVLCGHTCPKTVRVFSFADVGLKCSLHA